MFRIVSLSIIRSFLLYTQQYLQDCWQLARRLSANQYDIYHCCVYSENSCWWKEELSETCRVLFQKQIWEISVSSWFYFKNLSRCTVTWTSNSTPITYCWVSFFLLETSGSTLLHFVTHPLLWPPAKVLPLELPSRIDFWDKEIKTI